MDFDHPWALLSGLLTGLLGMSILIYGKKQTNLAAIGIGLAMCIFPYFITNLIAMWLCTGACLGGLWWLSKSSQ